MQEEDPTYSEYSDYSSCDSSRSGSSLSVRSQSERLTRSRSRSFSPRRRISFRPFSPFSTCPMPLHECEGSSRKRPREFSPGRPSSQALSFEFDEQYSIVHQRDCAKCETYMLHLDEAHNSGDVSFSDALKDRNAKLDLIFYNGVREGRLRQREDEANDVERYRQERNHAHDQIARHLRDHQDTHQTLRALQVENVQLRARLRTESLDFGEKLPARDVDVLMTDTSSRKEDSTSHHATAATTSSDLVTYAAVAGTAPSAKADKPANSAVISSPSLPVTENAALQTAPVKPSNHLLNSPRNLRQLKSLMNDAHQGNEAALAKVKSLCSLAHAAPREEKTEIQRYLLAQWRNPYPSDKDSSLRARPLLLPIQNQPNHATSAPQSRHIHPPSSFSSSLAVSQKINPRLHDPVEVWHAYLSLHPASWPRGVRRTRDGKPNMADLRASRTVARLRPVHENGANSVRHSFMSVVTTLFGEQGAYSRLVSKHEYRIASHVSYLPYGGVLDDLLPTDIARHFSSCGITTTFAVEELEPWAKEYLHSKPPTREDTITSFHSTRR